MDPLELKAELRKAADDKRTAQFHMDKASERIAAALRVAVTTEGITIGEAAEEVGISRQRAYRLMREH
jgi:hypothetical protein